jgi:hypothetical protein
MMKTFLDNRKKRSVLAYAGFILAFVLLLTGCGAPSGPPGARQAMGPPGAPVNGAVNSNVSVKPLSDSVSKTAGPIRAAENNNDETKSTGSLPGAVPGLPRKESTEGTDPSEVNPLSPMSRVEQAGNTVSLASEIIFLKTNPFLDRLPKPIVEAAASSTETEEIAPPLDPFANISLLGIAYNAKAPIALVAISGGETQTQMVRTGDLLMMDGGQIKVVSIAQDGVIFQKAGAGGEKRTITLPNLVGYDASAPKNNGSAPSSTPTNKGPKSASSSTPDLDALMGATPNKAALSPSSKSGKSTSNLANLKKLTQGTPEMNLKEP